MAAPDRLPRSPLIGIIRVCSLGLHFGSSIRLNRVFRCVRATDDSTLRPFGAFQFALQVGPPSYRSAPAAVFMAAAKRRALAICSNKNSLLLGMASSWFDALSHRPMRNARFCYRSQNLKVSNTSNLQARSLLGFSFRARRSVGARSSAMTLVSSAPKRKICAE